MFCVGNDAKDIENTCAAWRLVENVRKTQVLLGNLWKTHGEHRCRVGTKGKQRENTGCAWTPIENIWKHNCCIRQVETQRRHKCCVGTCGKQSKQSKQSMQSTNSKQSKQSKQRKPGKHWIYTCELIDVRTCLCLALFCIHLTLKQRKKNKPGK